MSDHLLERLHVANRGTFGQLKTAGGRTFHTMEREWADNRPRVSCIPPGRYQLLRYPTSKFTGFEYVYALVGAGVGLLPGPGILRSTIEIHPANKPMQLLGCIALGLDYSPPGLLVRSRPAVRMFIDELDATAGPHWLEIVYRFPH